MAKHESDSVVKEVLTQGDATILKLAGEIDMNHSQTVHSTVREVLEPKPAKFVIDLSEVTYIDSSGVSTLVNALRIVRAYGGKLGLVVTAPRVLSVMQITKLDQFFEIHATLQEALAS